jgi:SAM-dependent methyltransferase
MQRITEPELMTEDEQAFAYANADFEAPHSRFIELFRRTFPDWPGRGRALDLGCGPGDIAMRFARAYPGCVVDGIDGAAAMLNFGREILKGDLSLERCVNLLEILLPHQHPPHDQYDAIISNSLLHHLHDPAVLWNAVRDYAKPDAPVFIIDLMRPDTPEEAQHLTDLYTAGEPTVLRRDFHASLFAAFTPDEVSSQLAAAGLPHLQVSAISDRHLMIWGSLTCPIKPPSLTSTEP